MKNTKLHELVKILITISLAVFAFMAGVKYQLSKPSRIVQPDNGVTWTCNQCGTTRTWPKTTNWVRGTFYPARIEQTTNPTR